MPKTVEFFNFRQSSSAKNSTAIVFVHGFTVDVMKTWRRIPEFSFRPILARMSGTCLASAMRVDLRFDPPGLWSSDARDWKKIAIMSTAGPAHFCKLQTACLRSA